jgi:hypothetical protein
VPRGGAFQRSGGETGCEPPSQVYFFGMGAPGANAELVSVNDEPDGVRVAATPSPASTAIATTNTNRQITRRAMTDPLPSGHRDGTLFYNFMTMASSMEVSERNAAMGSRPWVDSMPSAYSSFQP